VTAHRRPLALLLTGVFGLLLLAPQPANAAAPVPARLAGTVSRVYDADTLEITPHGKVRLLGVDAPEKQASSRDDKFLALGTPRPHLRIIHEEGLAWCIQRIKGQRVSLGFDQPRRDRHGRLLAYVFLADGRLLNQLLLEEGLVIVYRRFPFRLKADFLATEAEAKSRGVGLWRGSLPSMPKKKSYPVSNQTTPQHTLPPPHTPPAVRHL
jgi:micrococcal nuclease